jgi:hypothetical protein
VRKTILAFSLPTAVLSYIQYSCPPIIFIPFEAGDISSPDAGLEIDHRSSWAKLGPGTSSQPEAAKAGTVTADSTAGTAQAITFSNSAAICPVIAALRRTGSHRYCSFFQVLMTT